LSLVGFSDDELAALIVPQTAGLTDPDEVPPLPADPVAVRGDVWLLGRHRLVCGDSTTVEDVDRALGGVKPHLMVTDPPYGVEYDPEWRAEAGVNKNRGKMGAVLNDDKSDWREAWALFPGEVVYVWHAGRHASSVQESLEAAEFEIRCQVIWAKDRFALSRGHYHWQHEPCWYAVRKGATGHWAGDRKQSTLWSIPARESGGVGHGTQKPVECMRRPIENNSSAGQAVYEPFSGSGTTIIAAEMTGRACHAIELNPAYIDVAIKRWQDFTGQAATLEGDGRTFAPSISMCIRPNSTRHRWVRTKWWPMIRATPALSAILRSGPRKRDGTSVMLQERRDGRGFLLISGASSEASLSMISVPRQVQDDLSKWTDNDAGDPEYQPRTARKPSSGRRSFKVSTPLSPIAASPGLQGRDPGISCALPALRPSAPAGAGELHRDDRPGAPGKGVLFSAPNAAGSSSKKHRARSWRRASGSRTIPSPPIPQFSSGPPMRRSRAGNRWPAPISPPRATRRPSRPGGTTPPAGPTSSPAKRRPGKS
jgi:DNA modification methylase